MKVTSWEKLLISDVNEVCLFLIGNSKSRLVLGHPVFLIDVSMLLTSFIWGCKLKLCGELLCPGVTLILIN